MATDVEHDAATASDRPRRLFRSHRPADRQLRVVTAVSLVSLLLIATFCVLYFARAVFFPITLAVILKLVFGPVIRRLNGWRIPNAIGAGLIVGGIFAISLGAIVFLSGPASQWIESAPENFRLAESKLRSFKKPIEKMNQATAQVDALTEVSGEIEPLAVQLKQPGISASILNTTGEVLVGIFMTLVMLYFLLANGDRFLEKLLSLTPDWSNRCRIMCLAREIQQSVSSYLFATTCINIVLGAVIGIGMWLAGLPNPVLWGVMAACLNYIPYFGCWLGGGIVFLAALISLESTTQALWAPAIYFVANMIEGYFITPLVLGRSISLSPLAIVIGMVLWGWLWGVGGLLLAVPLLAAIKIACDHIQPLHPFGQLLGR